MQLAEGGPADLTAEYLGVPGPAGINRGAKVMSLVGMAAGADNIDDLEHVASRRDRAAVHRDQRAPSTLGVRFLRVHVRSCPAVGRGGQPGTAGRWVEQARLLPGLDRGAIDIMTPSRPSTAGNGAQFGYTKIRGSTPSHDQAPRKPPGDRRDPVTPRGRARPPGRCGCYAIIATARRAGACRPILVRADSAYCRSGGRAVQAAGAHFSVGMPLNSAVLPGHRHHRDPRGCASEYPGRSRPGW